MDALVFHLMVAVVVAAAAAAAEGQYYPETLCDFLSVQEARDKTPDNGHSYLTGKVFLIKHFQTKKKRIKLTFKLSRVR